MESNNQNTNKVLVVIVIVLVLIIISMFCRGFVINNRYGMMWNRWGAKPVVNQYTQTNQNQNGTNYQSEQKSSVLAGWTFSPDFNLYYPSNWRYFGYIGEWAQSEFRITNENAVISWGNDKCSVEKDYINFQAGTSVVACLKGMRANIGLNNVRSTLSADEIKIFGDFVLKNK